MWSSRIAGGFTEAGSAAGGEPPLVGGCRLPFEGMGSDALWGASGLPEGGAENDKAAEINARDIADLV